MSNERTSLATRFSLLPPRIRFAIGGLIILLIWLVVLPALCRTDTFQRRDQFLHERGIDPSAMIYTELDRNVDR